MVRTTSAVAASRPMASPSARRGPWWTATFRPRVKRAASLAQLLSTAGGQIDQRRAVAPVDQQVGQQGRGLAQAHVHGQAPAEAGPVQEAEPAGRFGLVAAQLAGEAVRGVDRRRRVGGGAAEQVGGPPAAVDLDRPAESRCPPGRRRGG